MTKVEDTVTFNCTVFLVYLMLSKFLFDSNIFPHLDAEDWLPEYLRLNWMFKKNKTEYSGFSEVYILCFSKRITQLGVRSF